MTKLISTIKVHGASERAVQQAFAAVQDAAAMAANTLRVEGQNDERLEETREQTQKVMWIISAKLEEEFRRVLGEMRKGE